MHQSKTIQPGRWTHAHNDYAQLLAEGGVIGVLLVVLVCGAYASTLWKLLRNASVTGRLMVTGLILGIIAVAIHGLVEYGLHKPGNGIFLAALCGLALAAAHLRPEERIPAT